MQSAFSVNGGFKSVPYTCAAAQGDKLFKNIQCLHSLLGLRRQENRVFEFKRKKKINLSPEIMIRTMIINTFGKKGSKTYNDVKDLFNLTSNIFFAKHKYVCICVCRCILETFYSN